jgi:hypothetical protein
MFIKKKLALAERIEQQTAKVPSVIFLGAAAASVIGSLASFFSGRKQFANLVGEWVPTLLLLGMYSRLVKQSA